MGFVQISADAWAFMKRYIASTDELELLVKLVEWPSRWWDVNLVSRELGISESASRAMLDRFASANLLDIRVTGDVRYQFRPGTATLHVGAHALAAAYRQQHDAVVERLMQRVNE